MGKSDSMACVHWASEQGKTIKAFGFLPTSRTFVDDIRHAIVAAVTLV